MLNPEFTREGPAVRDYQDPDRVVLGVATDPDGHGEAGLRKFYSQVAAPVIVMCAIDAILTKLGSNLFLATKISFANELAAICDVYGARSTGSSRGWPTTPGSAERSFEPVSGSAVRASPTRSP